MADPVSMAAEEMAPAPPETSFFTGNAGPIFRAAAAGRRLDDQRLIGEEVSGLTQSRLQRRLQRRQDVLWDRDEQEYRDKQAFKARRGEFLDAIGSIDTSDPAAYAKARSELLASLPAEALEDDAVQSIIRYKDSLADDLRRQGEEREREARYLNRYETQAREEALNDFARLGGTEEELQAMLDDRGVPDVRAVYRAIGRKEADAEADKNKRAMEMAANEPPSDAKLKDRIDVFITDTDAFPTRVSLLLEDFKKNGPKGEKTLEALKTKWKDHYETAAAADKAGRDADEIRAIALKTPEEEFVNAPGISEAGREVRRKVWRAAHQLAGGTPMSETPVAPPPTTEPAPPAPAEDEDADLVNSLLNQFAR